MSFNYDALSNTFCGRSQYSNHLAQVMWHITNVCKLDCKFCFSKFIRGDSCALSAEQVDRSIMLFKKLGVLKVDISGGEPLLSDLLPYIVESCVESGIAVTLTSSGSGNNQNIEWIKDNWKKFARIILSLDGTETVHNDLRGRGFAYQNFNSFYKELITCGCNRVRVNTVVTKQLLEDNSALIDLMLELAPQEWCCIEPHPANKSSTFDDVAISTPDFREFIGKCQTRLERSSIQFLFRTREDYASYWTLYPNQMLCHLSELDTFDFSTYFSEENMNEILQTVALFPQYCIKKG